MPYESGELPLPSATLISKQRSRGLQSLVSPRTRVTGKASVLVCLVGMDGGTIQSKHNFSKLNMSLVAL